MSNNTDTTVSASGGDDTTVNDSVQGITVASEKVVPEDKAVVKDAKHDGMHKA